MKLKKLISSFLALSVSTIFAVSASAYEEKLSDYYYDLIFGVVEREEDVGDF